MIPEQIPREQPQRQVGLCTNLLEAQHEPSKLQTRQLHQSE
jgi:hypothetical protein